LDSPAVRSVKIIGISRISNPYFHQNLSCDVLHLNLKCVAEKTNLVQRNGFEHFSAVALEPSCGIANGHGPVIKRT
jgi:hypothetical protein